MTSVAESLPNAGQLAATLVAGVNQISQKQTLTFIQYTRVVLPLDGWVFWVRSDLVSSNTLSIALGVYLRPISKTTAPAPLTVEGSLHYATNQKNLEDETIAVNRVIFTSTAEVEDLNDVSPTTIYIATFEKIRFAFSQRKSFYKQAGLWHYEGDAVYPEMEQMIIDDPAQFDDHSLIVSNSLPIWLSMFMPQKWPQPPTPTFPLFPSFLVPDNQPPPYGAVHIVPDQTSAMQSAPNYSPTQSQYQLAVDQVRVTLYGVRNQEALDFQRFLYQYMVDTDAMGLLDMQVMRDQKRVQSELGILAIKKTFELRVSYLQTRVNDIAQKFILHCVPTYTVAG
jgi:hypothetical protein